MSKVAEYALAAHEYVRRAVGLELDGSVESLAFVDHYLSRAGDVGDELLALAAPALGAYFGELLCAHLGGEWVEPLDEDPASWRVRLGGAADRPLLEVHPVAMAAEALRRDDVPGFDAQLKPLPALADQLAEALAAVPPVEESYYYSLTGRYETIEHALAILAALEAARRPSDV
jgi:hypothetical protein